MRDWEGFKEKRDAGYERKGGAFRDIGGEGSGIDRSCAFAVIAKGKNSTQRRTVM